MPGMTVDPPARTMITAQKRLGRSASATVHPACPNEFCQRVYYHKDNTDELGSCCPFCEQDFPSEDPADSVLLYPRQKLVAKLERVLSIPGIESACFGVTKRNRTADEKEFGT
jgi:hypothetical protein